MKFNSDKILWIKNVKQIIEGDWAYDNTNDVNCDKQFQLHWSSTRGGKTNAKRANVNDIIVLFQRPDYINGKKNYKTYLTHLVTPVTKSVEENKNFSAHKNCREVKLLAMAKPINAIPAKNLFNFSSVATGGLTCEIRHLISKESLNETEVKQKIWKLFTKYFCEGVK